MKRDGNDTGLDWVREQIMTFACGAHAFGVERDDLQPDEAWEATFVVAFHGTDRKERLHCRAVAGEQHIRFWVDAPLIESDWKNRQDEILASASSFDVAVAPVRSPESQNGFALRFSTRAWIPRFSQRIFGLTFSNLMNCKAAF